MAMERDNQVEEERRAEDNEKVAMWRQYRDTKQKQEMSRYEDKQCQFQEDIQGFRRVIQRAFRRARLRHFAHEAHRWGKEALAKKIATERRDMKVGVILKYLKLLTSGVTLRRWRSLLFKN